VQDIVQRGEWLVPLKRATDIPSKPPLFHWSAAAASLFKGELNEPTIRLPSAVYATLGVLFLYGLGRKLFGGEVAFLGGAILATTTVYQNQALRMAVWFFQHDAVTGTRRVLYRLMAAYHAHSRHGGSFVEP
jgi:hypothetical protein